MWIFYVKLLMCLSVSLSVPSLGVSPFATSLDQVVLASRASALWLLLERWAAFANSSRASPPEVLARQV